MRSWIIRLSRAVEWADPLEHAALPRAELAVQRELGPEEDRVDRLLQVVRDDRGPLLAQLLNLLLRGDVAQDHRRTGEHTVGAVHRRRADQDRHPRAVGPPRHELDVAHRLTFGDRTDPRNLVRRERAAVELQEIELGDGLRASQEPRGPVLRGGAPAGVEQDHAVRHLIDHGLEPGALHALGAVIRAVAIAEPTRAASISTMRWS